MRKNTPILIGLLVCVILGSSCSVLSGPGAPTADLNAPLERVSLSERDCMNASGGLVPHLPLGVNQQIKAPVLAGGIVRSGDFLISIYLICDPSLVADDPLNPEYSWQGFSEVRYLGIADGWEITGYNPELEDLEIRTSLTINGVGLHGNVIGPEMVVSWGLGQGHYGPVGTKDQIVARAMANGEPLEIIYSIAATETLAAVRMLATFEETPDGYRLLSAEIGEAK